MDPLIAETLVTLGSEASSKSVISFSELIALKFFGKSIARLKAESVVEADKVTSRWEEIEKPMWLQAEAVKMNRQYNNLGNVLQKTSKYITAAEHAVSDDNDLFWGLLEHAKEITSDEMQDLIAKIIAGEYNSPNTYSMSTLQVLKSLGKNELREFEKLGSFMVDNSVFLVDFFSTEKSQSEVRQKLAINYTTFVELQNLGLIQSSSHSYLVHLKKDNIVEVQYFDHKIECKSKLDQENYRVPNRHALTKAGREILQHLNPQFSQVFFDWLHSFCSSAAFEVVKK